MLSRCSGSHQQASERCCNRSVHFDPGCWSGPGTGLKLILVNDVRFYTQ